MNVNFDYTFGKRDKRGIKKTKKGGIDFEGK
jgi:hypothetical protein